MAQPIAVVRKTELGFNEFGQVSETVESYVKISTSIRRGLLAFLSGSQFKILMCVAVHEADAKPGASLSDIARETGIKAKQTIIDSLDFLSNPDHQFIYCDGKEKDGTNRWRVCGALAWCGSDPNRGGGKKILPPDKKNIFLPSPEEEVHALEAKENKSSSASTSARVKEIFLRADGAPILYGEPLEKIAATVDAETAQHWRRWYDWILQFQPDKFDSPAGIVKYNLLKNPQARPQIPLEKIETDLKRVADERNRVEWEANWNAQDFPKTPKTPTHEIDAEARRIWEEVKYELQLQMTKSTFDTWFFRTHGVEYSDGKMTVSVHNQYAKEWIENRMAKVVARIVASIAERAVTVRYEVEK